MFRSRGLGRYHPSSNNRAAGPLLCFALAMALTVSVGQALPMAVPDTILLPDSLGPPRPHTISPSGVLPTTSTLRASRRADRGDQMEGLHGSMGQSTFGGNHVL
jgi:hypothetical protein